MEDKVGLFLLTFDESEKKLDFVLHLHNNLTIDDVDMGVLKGGADPVEYARHGPSLVISYNTQITNTFNIVSINIKSKQIELWHESYALFEMELTGFLLSDGDFLILNKFGMHLISLKGRGDAPRKIRGHDCSKKKLHSVGSLRYLRIADSNYIRVIDTDHCKLITINDMHTSSSGTTRFSELYRIKICQIGLRELMFVQSLFCTLSEKETLALIEEQPSLDLMFKNLFELELRSPLTYQI